MLSGRSWPGSPPSRTIRAVCEPAGARRSWHLPVLTRRPVIDDIKVYFPATLELVVVATAMFLLLGVPLGVLASITAGRWPDLLVRITAVLEMGMPAFWLALMTQVIFFGWLGWLPAVGRISPYIAPPTTITGFYLVDSILTGNWPAFVSTRAYPPAGQCARYRALRGHNPFRTRRNAGGPTFGLRPHGPSQGATGARCDLPACAPQCLDPRDDHDGIAVWLAFGRHRAGRDGLLVAWPWSVCRRLDRVAGLHRHHGSRSRVSVVFVLVNLLVDILYGLIDPRIREA